MLFRNILLESGTLIFSLSSVFLTSIEPQGQIFYKAFLGRGGFKVQRKDHAGFKVQRKDHALPNGYCCDVVFKNFLKKH